MSYKEVRLKEIAEIERAVKGKIYPAKTIYIQVSACNHNTTKFHITDKECELETKYAVIIPKVEIVPEYFCEVLEHNSDKFFNRYVGTNINIQMDSFNFFTLAYHTDLEEQSRYASLLYGIRKSIEEEEKEIQQIKTMKGYMLNNMFPK